MKPRTKNILLLFIIVTGIMSAVAAPLMGVVAGLAIFTPISLTNVLLSFILIVLMTIAIGTFNK